ncbi:MAG: glycosyltransferase [Candidatus Marinimicrobia bacterium]|nr:glycosyltransferase [Candidatus Neomarinimicrobiota bacterium]
MRILINAASANMGGAYTYLQNVLSWFAQVAPDDSFIVYAPEKTHTMLRQQIQSENIEFRDYPYSNTGGGARFFFDQISISRIIKRENIDILFSSTGFGTFRSICPEVILIRNPVYFNLEFQKKYEQLGRSLRRTKFRRWYSIRSMKNADIVLFPTHAMQGMVEQHTELGDKPTDAIHYGFDFERFFRHSSDTFTWKEKIEGWKKKGYTILLNISTYAVHKNFETLIEALGILKARGEKFKLLTSTSRDKTTDKAEYDALKHIARTTGVLEDWNELGYVPYEDLHQVYKSADVYVFPSFTESFGHSLVEAMASGLPVIAADMPVNREVCEPAGLYFPTFDSEFFAEILQKAISDNQLLEKQSTLSLKRAEHFSWEDYSRKMLTIFKTLND